MEHTLDDSEVGCSINLVTGEHYGPCKGSCGPDEEWEALAHFMGCTYEEAKVMLAAPKLLAALEAIVNLSGPSRSTFSEVPNAAIDDARDAIEEAKK